MAGSATRATAVAAVLLLAACGTHATSRPVATTAASAPRATNGKAARTPIVFEAPRTGDRHIYLTKRNRENKPVYVVRADAEKGEYFGENTGQSTFVNPHITFYANDGKTLVADAPIGHAVERARTVRLSGGAHALSSDHVTLRSDEMTYDATTEILHARGDVVMTSAEGSELRGSTLDWNLHSGAVDVAGAH